MTIEFHTPAPFGEVHEWVIDDVKKKLSAFHHQDKEISRAEVYFTKNPVAFNGDHVCEIELTVFGNSIMVQRNAHSYMQAAKEVLHELAKIVQEQVRKQKDLPDVITSSVRV